VASHPTDDIPPTSAQPGITDVQQSAQPASGALAPACSARDISLSVSSVTRTLGQVNLTVVATNSGSAHCTLQGFPTVIGETSGGTRIRTAEDMTGVEPPQAVNVRPGLAALVDLHLDQSGLPLRACDGEDIDEFAVYLGAQWLGILPPKGVYATCRSGSPTQFGVGAWTAALHSDRGDNDG
jgi:hypothetical protein